MQAHTHTHTSTNRICLIFPTVELMAVVEDVLICRVQTGLHTVLNHLTGSRRALQLLDLHTSIHTSSTQTRTNNCINESPWQQELESHLVCQQECNCFFWAVKCRVAIKQQEVQQDSMFSHQSECCPNTVPTQIANERWRMFGTFIWSTYRCWWTHLNFCQNAATTQPRWGGVAGCDTVQN